jgi:hypothetical protein
MRYFQVPSGWRRTTSVVAPARSAGCDPGHARHPSPAAEETGVRAVELADAFGAATKLMGALPPDQWPVLKSILDALTEHHSAPAPR